MGEKVSLDPALKPGETTEERNERLRTGKFEDRTPVGEKISNAIGKVAMPIMKEVGKMAAPAKVKDKPMKAGGFVRSADGCAVKGKTKGRMV
jgi:hypothetical protein